MQTLAVTAIGKDRPGIVAGVTGVLYELGCNLSDCSMTLLGGQFAMILLVEAPDGVTAEGLQNAMGSVAESLGLSVTVTEGLEDSTGASVSRPYVISVYGADRPGIVYRISDELARQGVNIIDLLSRMAGGIYTVMLDIQLPDDLDASSLASRLESIAAELSVEVMMRSAEPDAL